jgi:hypothetical protein
MTPCSSPSTAPWPDPAAGQRNGSRSPPALTLGTILQSHPAPGMVVQLPDHAAFAVRLAHELEGYRRRAGSTRCSPDRHHDDLRWIKEQWPGKLVVKGVQTVDDARRWPTVGWTPSRCPTRAVASSTGHRVPFHCCGGGRRGRWDMEIHIDSESCPAAISRRRRRTRRGSRWSVGRICTADGRWSSWVDPNHRDPPNRSCAR